MDVDRDAGAAVTRLRTALGAGAVLLAGLTVPSEAAPSAVSWKGTGCEEVVVNAPAPLATLQASLPQGYVAAPNPTAPALGFLYLAVARCARLTVDGVPQADAMVSDVGIALASAPGGAAGDTYHLWQVVGQGPLRSRTAALGLTGGVVPGVRPAFGQAGPVQTGSASVAWSGSDYALQVAAPTQVALTGGTSTWLHEGRRGRVRTTYGFSAGTGYSGPGTVRTSPGTALAALLGAPAGASAKFAYRTLPGTITATVRLER